MCNVIGYCPYPGAGAERMEAKVHFARLFREGSIRGLHAFGFAKSDGFLLRSFDMDTIISHFDPHCPTIAHARYCTSGDWEVLENNQPVRAALYTLVFNGVIHMGSREEMEKEFNVELTSENDGEVLLRLFQKIPTSHATRPEMQRVLNSLKGSFAGCWFTPAGQLQAARNARRPLWTTYEFGATWFASTRDIFLRAGFSDKMDEVLPGVVY